jgi:hypothetical protein
MEHGRSARGGGARRRPMQHGLGAYDMAVLQRRLMALTRAASLQARAKPTSCSSWRGARPPGQSQPLSAREPGRRYQ